MKLKHALLIVGLIAIGTVNVPVRAETAPAPAAAISFGIVNINKVMQTTDAAKGIFAELEGKRKEFQVQIAKAEAEVMKQKSSLSAEAFDAKRKEFEQKNLEGQKMVQEKRRVLDQAYSNSMIELKKKVSAIVQEIARERGYGAVLTQDAIMFALDSIDMTTEVVDRLNKTVKKIPIDWAAAKTSGKKK